MGKKITIDSSTLMNKILELIEAQRIFNLPNDKIDILIHPNSLVHAIVQFKNGLTKILYHETSMIIPIANAIFDGVDCLMVTGETAMGKYPVEVVKTLYQVINEAEGSNNEPKNPLPEVITKTADAISHAVCQIAEDLEIKVIMTMTHSGSTARMISRYRPNTAIYALTPFNHIARQLQLVWGIQSIKVDNS